MYKVGVIGPTSSVEQILNLGKEYELIINFIGYPYNDFKDTERIILEYDQYVDVWLFSSQISYMIARNTNIPAEKLVFIQHTESGIYKSLLHVAYDQKEFLNQISIDELTTSHLEQALQQIEFKPKDIYVKTFDIYSTTKELIAFHTELWESKKTKGALTCFEAVYLALKERGIPAYRISTTELEIKQSLKILAEKTRTFYFKDTQIGVQILEIDNFEKLSEKAKSSYSLQYLEINLKEILLRFCERLNGSLLEKGNGRYIIFSSRGTIEREIGTLRDTIFQLANESSTTVSVGIGYGETVHSAEVNAQKAIQLSKEKSEYGIIIIQEDGKVVQSVGEEDELSFSYRMSDKDLLSKLKKAKISVKNYNKLYALVRRMSSSDFTIKDLSSQLYWDESNARRIVVSLCEVDLAECIGEESYTSRGRPSKIYRLK